MTMHIQARVPLVCTYDSDADAAYIYFDHPIPAGVAEQVVPFEPEHGMFNLDLNADGHVLGVEIVGARKHLPTARPAAGNPDPRRPDQEQPMI
jgi:uncharacterized protein YuzE